MKTHQGLRWGLLSIGVGCVLAMGLVGFRIYYRSVPAYAGATWMDCTYASLRLFGFNCDGDWGTPKPLILDIARFVAPLLLAWGVIRVVLAIFCKQADVIRVRFMQQHCIVCGVSEHGDHLVSDLIARGKRVVVIERESSGNSLSALRSQGVICIEGDANEHPTLTTAGLERAASIFVMTGDDSDNLAIALTGAKLSGKRPHTLGSLKMYVLIGDPVLRDLLQKNHALIPPDGGAVVVVRPFNHFQNAARTIFQKYPLEVLGDGKSLAGDVHLVLPGLGRGEKALLIQAAQIGHFRNGKKINLHLVAPDPLAQRKELETYYPNLSLCINLTAEESLQSSDFVAAVTKLGLSLSADVALTVFVRQDDEQTALTDALRIAESLQEMKGHLRVHFHTSPDSPLIDIIRQNDRLNRVINVLSDSSFACEWEAVVGEKQDRMAKAIHEDWYEEETRQLAAKPTRPKKPAYKKWEDLTEQQKDSNRAVADFIPVIIRAAGLTEVVAKEDWSNVVSDPATVEDLARMEHDRWNAEKWLTGWTYAPQRADARKQHNDLVPYDQLNDETKQFDRNTILNLNTYLIRITEPVAFSTGIPENT